MSVGKTHLPDVEKDDRTCTCKVFLSHPTERIGVSRVGVFDHSASTEKTHDPRRLAEGAEHYRRSAILIQVADSLGAGAGHVNVRCMVRIEECECCGR